MGGQRFVTARLRNPFAIVLTAVLAVTVSCARDTGHTLDAFISEIEAGHATTPLIEQSAPGAAASVTFLVRSPGGQAPRIVSDVTGWGESPDDSFFDLTIGTTAQVGATRRRVPPFALLRCERTC